MSESVIGNGGTARGIISLPANATSNQQVSLRFRPTRDKPACRHVGNQFAVSENLVSRDLASWLWPELILSNEDYDSPRDGHRNNCPKQPCNRRPPKAKLKQAVPTRHDRHQSPYDPEWIVMVVFFPYQSQGVELDFSSGTGRLHLQRVVSFRISDAPCPVESA